MVVNRDVWAFFFVLISVSRGNELPYLDESVNPCDDFYKFTCGNFKNVHPLPTDALNIDHFTILQEEILDTAKHILESKVTLNDPTALQKAKMFYKACRDIDYADTLYLPSLKVLDNFGEWPVIGYENNFWNKPTWTEIGDIIADYGLPFFFDFTITSSHFNATSNVIYLSKDKLINPEAGIIGKIPDNLDVLAPGKQSRDGTEKMPYHLFLRSIARRLRDIRGTFKSNSAIEKEIEQTITYLRYISAGGIIPGGVEIAKLPNEVSIEDLQEWTDSYFGAEVGMNWQEFMNHAFKHTGVKVTKDMKVMLDSVQTTFGILNLYKMSDSDTVMNYIIGRLLTHLAPDSDYFMRDSLKTFYEALGYPVYERSDYCLRKTLGYPGYIDFGLAITYEYQRYHFNINKLEKAAEMVNDLLYAFLDILDEASWLDESSRMKAKSKARNMITLLAYPEFIEDRELLDKYYENLRICSWDHFGNTQRLRAFRKAINMKDVGVPKNRELWNISPLDVNAFYNRANNRILFPIAILNPAFFTGEIRIALIMGFTSQQKLYQLDCLQDIENSVVHYSRFLSSMEGFTLKYMSKDYARMGAIIGHEITHGFDATGSKYTEEGTLANWWTPETSKAFLERTGCFKDQYSSYFIDEIQQYVNGSYTLNENLADNGGLRAAYLAYQNLIRRPTPRKTFIRDYTDEQLFFIGFGTMWCMTETEYYLETMHKTQPYPPGRYRVIGAVSNNKQFAEAFNCPIGSNMNPEDKCVLW